MMYSHNGVEPLTNYPMPTDSQNRETALEAELSVLKARLRVLVDGSPLGIFLAVFVKNVDLSHDF